MSRRDPCAGCGEPAEAFAASFNGRAIQLCSKCAARLAAGESKRDVIRSEHIAEVKAA